MRCYLQMRDTQVSFISDSDDVSVNVCALVCLSVINELVVNNIWDEFQTPATPSAGNNRVHAEYVVQ